MKTVLIALLLAGSANVARAEDVAEQEARLLDRLVGRPAANADLLAQRRRGRRLRIAGHVTLGVSLAVLTAGMSAEGIFIAEDALSGLGDNCASGCRPDNIAIKEALAGAAMGIGALGALAGGLVLKMGVDDGRAEVSLAPQASNAGGGLAFKARF